MRGYRAAEYIVENLSLISAADNQQDFLSLHNGSDTHGISLLRNIINGSKETLIGFDGALGQVHAVRGLGKLFVRLVESDMAVVSQAHSFSLSGWVPSGTLVLSMLMLMCLNRLLYMK